MRLSKYNFFFPFEKDEKMKIGYNARTNALAMIENEQYNLLMELEKNKDTIIDPEVLHNFKKGGYVVEDDEDELGLIRYAMYKRRFATKSLSLTITPTLDCNFDCVYCYEKENIHNSTMSEEVQNEILELIEDKIKNITTLLVMWYGGESLLALNVIENLSEKMITLCNDNNVSYSAAIITNGYLLNQKNVKRLKALNIKQIQITLDGPPDIHDSRRPLKGGQGTFFTIIENLALCAEHFDSIAVRINVDKENISRIKEVLKIFEQYNLKNKVDIILGLVENTNECYMKEKCLNTEEFSRFSHDFYDSLVHEGFDKDPMIRYPKTVNNYCSADTENSFLIDCHGDMYKCWNDIGIKEYSIGNILSEQGFDGNVTRMIDYITFDPTKDEECGECKYLPICMGGCPYRRLQGKDKRCVSHKYVLDDLLKEIAAALS